MDFEYKTDDPDYSEDKLVRSLITIDIFAGHDINVIRIISTYGQHSENQPCSGNLIYSFEAAQPNRIVQSFTIDKYDRLWIAFDSFDKLSVFTLSGQIQFHLGFIGLKRPKHIKAVGDQLVITQFDTTFISVLEFTALSDGNIRHICRFDAMGSSRHRSSSSSLDCIETLNWCCRFGGFTPCFVPTVTSATISEQTKEIIVSFETHEHRTWFCVFSQGLLTAGTFEHKFYISTNGHQGTEQVFFLDHLERMIIINRQSLQLRCFDYNSQREIHEMTNVIKSWLENIHLSISDIASIATSSGGDMYIQGLHSEGTFVNPGLLELYVFRKQNLWVPGGPRKNINDNRVSQGPTKFNISDNITTVDSGIAIILDGQLLITRLNNCFNVYN